MDQGPLNPDYALLAVGEAECEHFAPPVARTLARQRASRPDRRNRAIAVDGDPCEATTLRNCARSPTPRRL